MLNESSTKDEILRAFEQYGVDAVLSSCLETLKSNKAFMLIAVEYDGLALAHASAELRDDEELVLAAINHSDGWAVFYASRRLKLQVFGSIFQATFAINQWAYYEFMYSLRNNETCWPEYNGDPESHSHIIPNAKEAFLKDLLRNPLRLRGAPFSIKDNKRIVLALVRINGLVLEYVSKRLQNEFKVVVDAVKQNGKALDFASIRLQSNLELLKLASGNAGIGGWFYYGSQAVWRSFRLSIGGCEADCENETMVSIDASISDLLDELSDEIRGRKSQLNSTLIAVSDAALQTHQRQLVIDESLRRTASTLEETQRENEQLKETIAMTGKQLVSTSDLLLEKDEELARAVSQLQETQQVLARKEAQLEQATAALKDSKTYFDLQIERIEAAQSTIESLSLDRDRALKLAEQIQELNQELREQSLQDRGALDRAKQTMELLHDSLQIVKNENEQLREETTILRGNVLSLTEKVRDLESSRALLLQKFQESQRPDFGQQDDRGFIRNESSPRFFVGQV